MSHWPQNVGIVAMEVYFPYLYVDQEKLEDFDGVSKGKYTVGLDQSKMGFCGDQEDINSLCLTVVHNLVEKNHINLEDVGRLEVGTETIIDKSKSVKSVLMQLFEDCGNTNIEGIDTTNACYGGTSALFNAINWVESSAWDGRLAIVVMADIAVYAAGNARCSGGCGAISLVVGPNAPIVFDRGLRVTHMAHVYDFYKPNLSSEYPVIDGQLSVKCYLSSLDKCYQRYVNKFRQLNTVENHCTLENFNFLVFHTPFCKMVRKSIARCAFNDFISCNNNNVVSDRFQVLEKYANVGLEKSLQDPSLYKEIEKASVSCSKTWYEEKTHASTFLARNVGNMYTPSLYASLASLLLDTPIQDLIGKRIVLFSYGSGLASSMFSVTVCPNPDLKQKLQTIIESLQSIKERLASRKEVLPEEFERILELREKFHNVKSYTPKCSTKELFPGTYYLTAVDEKFRRHYKRNNFFQNGC